MTRWLKTFPVPAESPAHHVRDLRFSISGYHISAGEFSKYTPWFTNAERMTLSGHGSLQLLSTHPVWPSVTSLTINPDGITPSEIQDVMALLPNLDDLSLSEHPGSGARVGTGAVPRRRFGGQLRLFSGSARSGIVDILLGIPTGLYFTEVQIHTYEYLLSTVRLVEACSKTLAKLSYTISPHCKSRSFSRFWRGKY